MVAVAVAVAVVVWVWVAVVVWVWVGVAAVVVAVVVVGVAVGVVVVVVVAVAVGVAVVVAVAVGVAVAVKGRRMTDEELVKRLRDTQWWQTDYEVRIEAAEAIERLTRERDAARAGNYSANEHEPTWAELADYWKHCAEAAERKVEKLREALSFVGNISHSEGDTAGICDIVTAALADTEKMKD